MADCFLVEGWAFHEQKRIVSTALYIASESISLTFPLIYGYPRADVRAEYPFENASTCGFRGVVRAKLSSNYKLSVKFQLEDHQVIELQLHPEIVKHDSMVRRVFSLITRRSLSNLLKAFLRGDMRYILWQLKKGWRLLFLSEIPVGVPSLQLSDSLSLFQTTEPEIRPLEQEIDIVIPVYNASRYLLRLFQSLVKNTTSPYRLIIVDDGSTDPEVWPLLNRIAQEHPNTVLIRNPVNQGFPKAVNTGAQYTRNHFVILNTDVEVPKGWLERLMRPIIEDSSVASTTPFSNNATICSFPNIGEDNRIFDIFDNLDVDQVDQMFRRVKGDAGSFELPSGVGFCMGINRRVWMEIGAFDEKTFGLGYGEENDWCMRARRKGYRNVLVPNLFVYHKGAASHGNEQRNRLMQDNLRKLLRRYPEYQELVDSFLKSDPARPLRSFLMVLLASHFALKKPLLLVDHEIGGGANKYRRELIEERLNDGQPIFLLTYDQTWLALKLRFLYKWYETSFLVSEPDELLQLTNHIAFGEILYNNLVSFDHCLGIVRLLRTIKEKTGATLTLVIHDFFPICPSYNLLNWQGVFCHVPEDLGECYKCLPVNPFAAVDKQQRDIGVWRKEWKELFEIAECVLCPSESALTLIKKVYPLHPQQAVVRPHRVPKLFSKKPALDFTSRLNIGIIGAINYAKGSKIVTEMAELIDREGLDARITVIGTLDCAPTSKSLTITGPYQLPELPGLIEKYRVNVCFLPSIWPETFSYVISELMQLGMPICCFDLGAQAERIRKYELGRIITKVDPQIALQEILEFYDDLKNLGGDQLVTDGRSPRL
jgi:GT2 family glycosyltransferase